jgi:hypothetical protein
MVKFTMSRKREKSHKGVEDKTKTKSYGRNGERRQSNKVTGKEWEVKNKNEVTWMECKMHVTE